MAERGSLARVVGLVVAFGGPAVLISPVGERLPAQILILWLLLGIVIAIVRLWEKEPLASMGIRPFAWSSIGWGLLLAAFTIYLMMPTLESILRWLGIAGFEAGMAKVLALPLSTRIVAVITAAVVEDSLFLGYGFTRLTMFTGKKWLAGIVTVILVSALHFPHWGLGPMLAYFVAVGVGVAFFAWRRDLLANIVAHLVVDGMGIVVVPVLSSWAT